MATPDIEPWQAEKVRDQLVPMLRYLAALKDRLYKRGIPKDDDFYQAVERAHDAVHGLWVTAHYRSCKSGVGRRARE